jgi:hypothetical protein
MATRRAMTPRPIAPWAEVVPGAPYPTTVAELLDRPDKDGDRYEVVSYPALKGGACPSPSLGRASGETDRSPSSRDWT